MEERYKIQPECLNCCSLNACIWVCLWELDGVPGLWFAVLLFSLLLELCRRGWRDPDPLIRTGPEESWKSSWLFISYPHPSLMLASVPYISAEKYVLVYKNKIHTFFFFFPCSKDMNILLLLWPHQIWRGLVSTYHYSTVYKAMRMNEVFFGGLFFWLISCIPPNHERNQISN